MKAKLYNQYTHLRQWIGEDRLIQERHHQLEPIETLQDDWCKANAVNLYYQNESANEPNINIDFEDVVSEAWAIVNCEH